MKLKESLFHLLSLKDAKLCHRKAFLVENPDTSEAPNCVGLR